ncbi:mandelate racemase/muconate lactonizing enzyme family protein [Pseudomonas sp. NPDC089752]|uniref:mandelate racemase/muconate lactonizing enzyme family protein n=1 Tax=Pseudomonas sp. NPDC089752 TaxID=3364472 RepID=UPI0038089DA4
MKIKTIEVYQYDLPVKNGPYRMAGSDVYALSAALVKMTADEGAWGWGETCPLGPVYAESHIDGALAALKVLAKQLIGTEVMPNAIAQKMAQTLNGHHYAKSAIDIACYDLLGKILGVPVSTLLGGAVTAHIPSYYAAIIASPEETARTLAEKQKAGYSRLQVKVGGRAIEEDIETLHRVWERIKGTDTRLAADANRGLLQRDAIRLSQACKDIPFILEQPCDSFEELKAIRPLICHAVYMDESSTHLAIAIDAIASGSIDGFGMKVSRLGGLRAMQAFRDACAAKKIPHTCDDAWGGDIVAAACVQMAATVDPRLLEGTWIAEPYIDGHYDQENPIVVKGGRITVSKAPGLGINVNEKILKEPVMAFD